MSRLSKYRPLSNKEIAALEEGYCIPVNNKVSGPDLKVRSLKSINREAYDAHVCEVTLGSETWRGNVEELLQVLRLV